MAVTFFEQQACLRLNDYTGALERFERSLYAVDRNGFHADRSFFSTGCRPVEDCSALLRFVPDNKQSSAFSADSGVYARSVDFFCDIQT